MDWTNANDAEPATGFVALRLDCAALAVGVGADFDATLSRGVVLEAIAETAEVAPLLLLALELIAV